MATVETIDSAQPLNFSDEESSDENEDIFYNYSHAHSKDSEKDYDTYPNDEEETDGYQCDLCDVRPLGKKGVAS